jgi:hypothetical protein
VQLVATHADSNQVIMGRAVVTKHLVDGCLKKCETVVVMASSRAVYVSLHNSDSTFAGRRTF